MDLLKNIILATLLGGSVAFASIPEDSAQLKDFALVSSWMAHLNYYYPELHLTFSGHSSEDIRVTLEELDKLETFLQKQDRLTQAPPLTTLACSRAVCGGGGMGKCTTCD